MRGWGGAFCSGFRSALPVISAALLALCLIPGMGQASDTAASTSAADIPAFLQIGDFSVRRVSDSRTEVRDGSGRTLVLIPKDAPLPPDCDPKLVLRVPVQRVAAYGNLSVAAMQVLGVAKEALAGVTLPEKEWARCNPDIAQSMREGRVVWLGDPDRIDYERLKQLEPDLVISWDATVLPLLNDLRIPVLVAASPLSGSLEVRMRYVQFLAPFFGKEREAAAWFAQVETALAEIRARAAGVSKRPGVMWGGPYGRRILVEPGNSWESELIELAGGNFLFKDVFGASSCCVEISLERFLLSGAEAELLFTYGNRTTGITSKAAVSRMNPLIQGIAPLKTGRVYAPAVCKHHASVSRMGEMLTEIAAILHPELYPDRHKHYFEELPERDPQKTATAAPSGPVATNPGTLP